MRLPLPLHLAEPGPHAAASAGAEGGAAVTLSLHTLSAAVAVGELIEALDLRKGAYGRADLGGGIFSRCQFGEADLREADLRECVFDQCDLRGVLMAGALLRKAVFNRCRMDHADLRSAMLHGAVLTECQALHAQLGQAQLSMALVSKTRLDHAVLRGADLDAATFSETSLLDVAAEEAVWRQTTLYQCGMQHMSWRGARLERVAFVGAVLAGMDFRGLALQGCQFLQADLRGADFSEALIAGCNFQQARLDQARFARVRGSHALFCQAEGSQVDFREAQLRQALFTGAQLPGACFADADLFQVHLAGAALAGADLRGAELAHADLRHADLTQADLRGAGLMRTVLHGARTEGAQMCDRARALETDPDLAQARTMAAPSRAESQEQPHVTEPPRGSASLFPQPFHRDGLSRGQGHRCRMVRGPWSRHPAPKGWAVVSGGLQVQARRAVGCLLAPRPGDTVACLRVAPAQWWVMNVLQRDESDAPHLLSLPGDALLQAEGGTLSLQAEALDLRAGRSLAITAPQAQVAVDGADVVGRQLRVSAGVFKLVGSVLSTVMERVQHHSRHYLRRTEGLDQVHATHLNCEAEQTLRLSGEHALVNGEKLVKARGAQIHFG